jgi:phage-related protein
VIAIPDAGEIKAKVTIEYDPAGVDKAKEDLKSLADVAGNVGGGAGSASDGLAALGEQLGANTVHVSELSSALGDLPKMLESGGAAASGMNETLAASGSAIDNVGESVQKLQEPLGTTVSMLGEVSPPMAAITEHAQSMEKQLSGAGESFAQIGESLSQSIPLLPQYAESMQGVMAAMQPTLRPYDVNEFMQSQNALGLGMLGGPPVADNMAVFQAALSDPTPFDMIDAHLNATGQTYGDFASSIGKDNATMLHEMNNASNGTYQVLGNMSDQVQAVGKDFHESASSAQEFADQFNGVNKAVGNGFGRISDSGILEGPLEYFKSLEPTSIGEGFGNALGGVMDVMNKVAMPIMAVQMIGMAVSGAAQGIYNMAAIAEGPGAHGVGSFTGTVDALGQSLAQTGQQFSEGFGKAITPTLQQMNMEASQGSGSGGIGGFLGGLGSTLVNLGRIGTGMDVIGGFQGLMNQAADMAGMPLPFQGPDPQTQAAVYTKQQMGLIPQNVQNATAQADVQTANVLADATNPAYLQSQDNLSAAQKLAQHLQTSYDISHPVNAAQQLQAYQMQQMDAANGQAVASQGTYLQNGDIGGAFGSFFGGVGSGVGGFFGNLFGGIGQDFNNLFGGGGGINPSPGCFPAGTPVLMADGSERAIETLQVGDQVLARGGAFFVPTTVLARIVPPPKRVYTLTFDSDKTLTLTDSHPVMTEQGWKSLHPRATKQENPDLDVSTLHIGDRVHTTGGMVTLVGIRPGEVVPIYNITVDEPHTFYASGILVHNKMGIGSQISDQVAGIQLPHIDLSGMASSLGSSFSNMQLPHLDLQGSSLASSVAGAMGGGAIPEAAHTITASVNWVVSGGLEHTFEGVATWVASELAHTFEGLANWVANGELAHTFEGIANWIASGGLQHTFEGVADWIASGGLQHTFEGVASWVANGLEHMFEGIASWIGQGLEHTFTGVASWIGQGLSQTFTAVASFVQGFASGVEGFQGGLAVVGEQGPELLELPQGSSVYPMSSSSGMGSVLGSAGSGGGGGMPQSVNVIVEIAGQPFINAMGIPMAQNIRVGTGMRSF